MAMPKLRFKEFSKAWYSSNFKQSLIQIIDGDRGINYPKSDEFYSNEYCLFLNAGNVTKTGFKFESVQFINEQKDNLLSKGKLNRFDIVITTRGTVGNVGFYDKSISYQNIRINSGMVVVRSPINIIPVFIYQFFYSFLFEKWLVKNVFGSAQPQLTVKLLNQIPIKFPLIEEQTKIANFLSAVDERINQLSQKVELLTQYKQGMMQKLFSQQIRFKAEDGSEFSEWGETALGQIGTFIKGKGISKADIVEGGNLACIRYGELYTSYKEAINDIKSFTNIDSDKLILSKKNDVLIPASGETQLDIATASCVMLDDVALSGDINIFRSTQNGIFLSYLIRSKLKLDIAQLAQGNAVVHLYPSQLQSVKLHLPSISEQTKIANFLSSIDQKIDLTEQQLQQAQQWKKGLLQQMFV